MQPRAIKALIVGLAVVAIGALVVWKLRTPGDVREAAAPPMWTEQQFAEIDAQIAQGKLGAAHTKLVAALAHRAAHRAELRDEDRARLLLRLGRIQIAAGDSTSAITNLTEARDAVISTLGDRSPALAPYDDELAAAERARGSIRRALALHDRSLALQPDNAIALLARARTKLEGGDVLAADHDATQAKALLTKAQKDPAPAFELLADIAQERGVPELAQQLRNSTHPIDPPDDELLTVERARFLARNADADTAHRMAAVVTDKSDAALALAAGEALLAAGDKAAATELLRAAAKRLGNEPTRTALHLMVALAKASQDPQAARTAISLYQAMPKLDRADIDAMWALAKAPR